MGVDHWPRLWANSCAEAVVVRSHHAQFIQNLGVGLRLAERRESDRLLIGIGETFKREGMAAQLRRRACGYGRRAIG